MTVPPATSKFSSDCKVKLAIATTLNPLLKEKNDENYVMMRVNRFPIFRLPQSIAQKLLTCLFKSKLEVKNDDKKIREKREEEWE